MVSAIHKRLSREARREQLIRMAMTCYGELGVERAGHGDIAKLAGVSTATVFNYFGTREILTEAIFQNIYDVYEKMFETIAPGGPSPENHIEQLAETYVFLVKQHPDILKVVLNWSCSFGQSVRPQYLEFQDWLLNGIQRRLHQNDNDRSDSRIILATAYNYARMKLDNTPEDVLDRFVARTIKALS